VIKDKTGVFIELVKLNECRECRDASPRASTKIVAFAGTKRVRQRHFFLHPSSLIPHRYTLSFLLPSLILS
jgi:hypothetical protein